MHKYVYENLPASFHDMFNSVAEPNRTKSYKLERVLFKTLECFPSAFFPKIWNSIDFDDNFANNLLKTKSKNKYFKKFGAKKSRNELVR